MKRFKYALTVDRLQTLVQLKTTDPEGYKFLLSRRVSEKDASSDHTLLGYTSLTDACFAELKQFDREAYDFFVSRGWWLPDEDREVGYFYCPYIPESVVTGYTGKVNSELDKPGESGMIFAPFLPLN